MTDITEQLQNKEFIEQIVWILRKGNDAVIKKERDQIVIVETERKVRKKIPIDRI